MSDEIIGTLKYLIAVMIVIACVLAMVMIFFVGAFEGLSRVRL